MQKQNALLMLLHYCRDPSFADELDPYDEVSNLVN